MYSVMYMQELARRMQQQEEVAARQKPKQQRAQQQTPTLPGEDAASLVRTFMTV